MLLNNVESDLKTRLEKEDRITRGREQLVNKTFLKMMDKLGYDVELTYKKRAVE